MTRDQVVALARLKGFTHVGTVGGPVPLEAWRPYGGRPDYQCTVEVDPRGRPRIYDLPPTQRAGPGQAAPILGAWRLLQGVDDPRWDDVE